MNKLALGIPIAALAFAFALPAAAQSGHFLTGGGNAPICTATATQVTCTGKVAGLGGTTFEIRISAPGIASVECINPAGNRAPGQDTNVLAAGTTDPLPTPQNGQFKFSVTTDSPTVPATPTCPNRRWTPEVVSVAFTNVVLSLFEDNVLSDQVTVSL